MIISAAESSGMYWGGGGGGDSLIIKDIIMNYNYLKKFVKLLQCWAQLWYLSTKLNANNIFYQWGGY